MTSPGNLESMVGCGNLDGDASHAAPLRTVDATSFSDAENWHGGFYELSVELGSRSDERLDAAIRAIWSDPQVEGCWVDRNAPVEAQERVECSLRAHQETGHLRGVARLPSGSRVVCGTVVIREDDSGADWVDFYLPLGALVRVDERVGAYPFGAESGAESLVWREAIDSWLVEIGERVFRVAPFEYALIGHEVSGESPPDPQQADRYVGCLVPREGGLSYLPATC